ncbi:MAG TPA: hypothetical protein VD770_02230, partial [Coxiellaceae bacterium]|nr:hypothetical protein [Coxiellaceae bacterium]
MPQTLANSLRLYALGKRDLLSQADCYWRGLHVERDENLALELCQEAAHLQQPGASFRLAQYYQHMNQYDQALEYYYQAYQEGNLLAKAAVQSLLPLKKVEANAKVYLARILEQEKKWSEAQELYQQAIGLGFTAALYYLANLLREDRYEEQAPGATLVIAKNNDEALSFYKEAAALGNLEALMALRKEASSNAKAALFAAQIYELTTFDSALDAMHFYNLASDLGNFSASFRLAQIYETGQLGIASNLATAVNYYFLTIRQGSQEGLPSLLACIRESKEAELEFKLAEFYEQFFHDKLSALVWYKQSFDHDYRTALKSIEDIAVTGAHWAYQAACL